MYHRNLKKALMGVGAGALLVAALTVPAAAHGGHHGGCRSNTTYPVCSVSDCTQTGRHSHDGTTYCGSGYCADNGACYGHSGGHRRHC